MGIDRRQFVQTVGGAGMFAAFGQTGAAQQDAGDFEKPAGLRPGAQLDSRFPVSFAKPVSEGLRLVMEYFTALSQRDLEGIAHTLHFPFAIYETIDPIVVPNAAAFMATPPPSLNGTGKGDSHILRGSYICSRASMFTSTARWAPRSRFHSPAIRLTATSNSRATACTR